MSGGRILAYAVGAIAVVVLGIWLIRGAYTGFWWLSSDTTKHSLQIQRQQTNGQNQIAVQGNANQQGQVARIDNDMQTITTIEVQQLHGTTGQFRNQLISQIVGTGNDACQAAVQVSNVELGHDRGWVQRNCQGGSLSPTSPLYKIK